MGAIGQGTILLNVHGSLQEIKLFGTLVYIVLVVKFYIVVMLFVMCSWQMGAKSGRSWSDVLCRSQHSNHIMAPSNCWESPELPRVERSWFVRSATQTSATFSLSKTFFILCIDIIFLMVYFASLILTLRVVVVRIYQKTGVSILVLLLYPFR